MGKNKGQNNTGDMRNETRAGSTNETTRMQTQNKADAKKGTTEKSRGSGAQG